MRKTVLLALLFIVSQTLQAQKDTILLFHPTTYNIATIEYLLENNLLQLENIHFKGVYHITETYNYKESQEYLEINPHLPFSLHGVYDELPGNMIFEPNLCSAEFKKLFSASIGSFFMGGPDIPPAVYNESTHLLTNISDPGRHYFELSYLYHIMGGKQKSKVKPLMKKDPDYGVLGICLGMQTINVATGGSMIQDIPLEVYGFSLTEDIIDADPELVHTNYYPMEPISDYDGKFYTSFHFHPIIVKPGFLTYSDVQTGDETPQVLSSHHQAIQEIGKGLSPVAISMDGKIIEAIKHKKYKNVFAVQFHPEKTALYDADQEFRITSDSIINFNQFIIENDSHDFHTSLWKGVSQLFKQE